MADEVLFLVLARNGSKGLKDKNVRSLLGKPLILHTLDLVAAAPFRTFLAVSTDGDPIAAACRGRADLVIERPAELATDTAPRAPVLRHALEECERRTGRRFDYIFDFLCTAPLRTQADLAACWDLVRRDGVDNVITATPARRSPYFNMVELGPEGAPRLSKPPAGELGSRQASPPVYDMNGSVYAWKRAAFLAGPRLFTPATRLHVMPEETALDVDTPFDFSLLEAMMTVLGREGRTA